MPCDNNMINTKYPYFKWGLKYLLKLCKCSLHYTGKLLYIQWEIKCSYSPNTIGFSIFFVFHRKDLFDAKHKTEMSSKFQMRCTPLVEASGGWEQYYIRSSWHVEQCNCKGSGQSDVPPVETSGGQEHYHVRSAWHLQSCIRLAWHFEEMQTYPPLEASGGQEQYYIRSALHLFAHFMFSCCRCKSYIGIWIGDMSSWTLSNLCRLLCCCCCCCCCCYCFMLLLFFICNCGSTTTDEQETARKITQ